MKYLQAATLVAASALTLRGQQFTYQTIDHPSGDNTFLRGVSGNSLVGYYQNSGSSTSYGFLQTAGTFASIAGSIGPGLNNTVVSIQPTGIFGNTVVGGGLYTMGGSPELGFAYNIQSGAYTIMPQGFGGASMIATGIGNDVIVGYAGQVTPPGNSWRKHSFSYDTNGYSAQLDYPDPLSLYEGIALSTLAQGTDGATIVGYHLISDYNPQGVNYNYHGFVLNKGNWTTIDAPGSFNTYAHGIDAGNIVGYFNDLTGVHGFIYDGSSYRTLDVPGAVETRAYGISGDTVIGTYLDSLGLSHGFATTLPDIPISVTINELDSRVTKSKNLLFLGGALEPTTAASINSPIIVSDSSSGTINSRLGSINLLGTVQVGLGSSLIITGTEFSSTHLAGAISGPGVLTFQTGTNSISGLNSAGGLVVNGGMLTAASPNALPTSGNILNNGKIILDTPFPGTTIYNHSFELAGPGPASSRILQIGSTSQAGPIRLTGPINLSSSSIIATEGQAGGVRTIEGSITAATAGIHLTINTRNSTQLTITGPVDGYISQINKTGSGTLNFNGGNSYAGLIDASEGKVVIMNPTSLGLATLRASGGSIVIEGNNLSPFSSTFTASMDLASTPVQGPALMLGSANLVGNANYSGAITFASSTSDISTAVNSGGHTLSGLLISSSQQMVLSLNVAAESYLQISTHTTGFNGSLTKNGLGTLRLDREMAGTLTSASGKLILGPAGIAGAIVVANGSQLEVESTTQITRQITQTIYATGGTNGSPSITFGSVNQGGTLEITSAVILTNDAYFATAINSTTSTLLAGVQGTGRTLTLDVSANSEMNINAPANLTQLIKDSSGTLTLSSVLNGNLQSRQGITRISGQINGSVTISNGSILKGNGTISGNLTNAGVAAPGNSPGVLNIIGSYTSSAGSFYEAEIAGNGGPGSPNGHDMISVTGSPGTFVIQPNSGLRLLKLNGFEPSLGENFRLINASGGITGDYATISSQFSQWLLYDRSSGRLFATGLLPGQTFSQVIPSYGDIIWENAVSIKSSDPVNGYTGTFDGTTTLGQAILTILSGDPLPGSTDASPYLVAPSVLISTIRDESYNLFSLLQGRRFERAQLPQPGWTGFAQYNQLSGRTSGSNSFSSSGATLGLICDLTRTSSVQFAASNSKNQATFVNNHGRFSGNGFNVSASFSTLIGTNDAVFIDACVSAGRNRVTTYRNTFFGSQNSASDTSNFGAFTRLGTGCLLLKSLSITPYVGLDHVRVAGCSAVENGDLSALTAKVKATSSQRALIGATFDWVDNKGPSSTKLSLSLEAFDELGTSTSEVAFTGLNTPQDTLKQITRNKGGLRITPRAEYSPDKVNTFYLNYTHLNSEGEVFDSFNFGFRRSF